MQKKYDYTQTIERIKAKARKERIEDQIQKGTLVNFSKIKTSTGPRKYKDKDGGRVVVFTHSFGVAIDDQIKEWLSRVCTERSLERGYKVSPADLVRELLIKEINDEAVSQIISESIQKSNEVVS